MKMQKINFASTYFALSYFLLSILYIAIALNLPVSIYTTAIHDDAWFIQNGESILLGKWLGSYTQMTLIKGPAYAYFLAANKILHLPISFSIATLYIAACLFTAHIFRIAGASPILSILFFAVLLFHPAQFPMRVIRDNIYPALTLLTISGLAYTSIRSVAEKNKLLIALTGLIGGFFWITREEGIWIIPGAIILIMYGFLIRAKRLNKLLPFLLNLSIFFTSSAAPILLTMTANYVAYNSFEIVEAKRTSFVRAINAINSVSIDQEITYLPAPHEKREKIYQISPTFSELKPFFEIHGKAWAQPGCLIYPHTCGDYAGGWFMWALRDGVSALGQYSSPQQADDFYNRITSEIQKACHEKILKCNETFFPYAPQINMDIWDKLGHAVSQSINLTMYQTELPLMENPSWGPAARLSQISLFLGKPQTVPMSTNPPNHIKLTTHIALSIKGWLIDQYKHLSPILFFSAALIFCLNLIGIVKKKLKLHFLFIFAASLWTLYISRILLVSLIDVTSFPAVTHLYLMPAYPILTAASIGSLAAFFYSLEKRPKKTRHLQRRLESSHKEAS